MDVMVKQYSYVKMHVKVVNGQKDLMKLDSKEFNISIQYTPCVLSEYMCSPQTHIKSGQVFYLVQSLTFDGIQPLSDILLILSILHSSFNWGDILLCLNRWRTKQLIGLLTKVQHMYRYYLNSKMVSAYTPPRRLTLSEYVLFSFHSIYQHQVTLWITGLILVIAQYHILILLAPRCRLIDSILCNQSIWKECSSINHIRELGSERWKSVWSISLTE